MITTTSPTRRTSVAGALAGLVVAGMTVASLQTFRVGAITADESTFEPLTPCRLFDTRPATQVGPKSSPMGPSEEYDIQVTGSEGECVIPAAATAVSINLTGVGPTDNTFLSMYPADATNPGTAVLNMAAGASPTPNKIDVKVSAAGQVTLFNRFGDIHVVGDVMGYYRNDSLADLEARVVALEAQQPFAVGTVRGVATVTADDTVVTSLTVDPPVDGHLTVTSTVSLSSSTANNRIRCSIGTDTTLDFEYLQAWESPGAVGELGQLAGTRTFEVDAGSSITPRLVCDSGSSTMVYDATLSAIFTPAP